METAGEICLVFSKEPSLCVSLHKGVRLRLAAAMLLPAQDQSSHEEGKDRAEGEMEWDL